MKTLRTWPSVPMIASICAVLSAVAVATLVGYHQSSSPVVPNAVNVNRIDDQIGNNRGATGAAGTDRSEANASSPFQQ